MSDPRYGASDRLRDVLGDDERLRWRATPHRRRLLLDSVPVVVPVLVVVGMVGAFLAWMVALSVAFTGGDATALFRPIAAVAALVVLLVVAGGVWVARRRYDAAEYAATDRRLVAITGAFGRDASSVDWGRVRDLEVEVGALDPPFDTGTIHVATEGSGGLSLRYLPRPYEIAAELDALRTGEAAVAEPDASGETTAGSGHPETGAGDPAPERADTRPGGPTAAGGGGGREPGPGRADDDRRSVSATLVGLLRDDEELRWHYRPPAGDYLRQSVVGALLAGLVVWSVFYGLFVGVPVLVEFGPVVESVLGVRVTVALAGGWLLLQVGWLLVVSLGAYGAAGRLEFAATDRRAIKVGGMVGLDTSSVEWSTVTDVELERTLLTRLFGTGNVVLRSGGGGETYRGGGVRFAPVADPLAALDRLDAIRHEEDDRDPILVGRAGRTGRTGPTAHAGDLSSQARAVLRDGEAVRWRGRPAALPYVGPRLVGGVLLTAAGGVGVRYGLGLFAVVAVFAGLGTAAGRALSYRNVEYVATDQRVLSFGGAVGRDASSVDWADVHDVEVRTGLLDGPFGTGTLRFSRAGSATPLERAQTGDDDRPAFTGVRFQRVPDARAVAESLEQGRRD